MAADSPGWICSIARTVKWGECDPAGIVYTPRFSDYVVEAHLASFEQMFGRSPYDLLRAQGLALPAKALTVEFKKSLRPNQSFVMKARIAEIRTRTFDVGVDAFTDDGSATFSGTLTLICLNLNSGKSQPLPEFLLTRLRAALNGGAPPV
jgi:YbgC/YbaW family acyl-CoA thioester hydrolase